MVRLLLRNGAKIGEADVLGGTALDWAKTHGSQEIVELIESEPHKREIEKAKVAREKMAAQLKTASLMQLLQKYSLDNEIFLSELTDALVEAKVTKLPRFVVTASYEEKTAMQVALQKRLFQSAVERQQCNNEAQGYAEQGNTPKTTERRNLATAIISYQTILKAIKVELEENEL